MTELKLRLMERYALIPLLPQQGGFQLLTRVKNLIAALELGEAEAAARGIALEEGQIVPLDGTPRDETALVTGVPVHDEQVEIVVSTLKDLEARSALPLMLLDAYQRLVLDPQNDVLREAEGVASGASDGASGPGSTALPDASDVGTVQPSEAQA